MGIMEWLKGLFSKAIRAFKSLLKAAIPIVTQIIIGQLSDFALETVSELNGVDLTNEEKRTTAFNKIARYAKNNGVEARDSIINTVIELAVLAFKKEF